MHRPQPAAAKASGHAGAATWRDRPTTGAGDRAKTPVRCNGRKISGLPAHHPEPGRHAADVRLPKHDEDGTGMKTLRCALVRAMHHDSVRPGRRESDSYRS
jgi:hypothetical protein